MKMRLLAIAVALIATVNSAKGIGVLLNDLRQVTAWGDIEDWGAPWEEFVLLEWPSHYGPPWISVSSHSEPAQVFCPYSAGAGIGGTSASQSSTITGSFIEASGSSQTILAHPPQPYPSHVGAGSASVFGVEFRLTSPHGFHLEGDVLYGLNGYLSTANLYLQGPSGNIFEYDGHYPAIDLTGILPVGDYLLYASAATDGSVYRGESYASGSSYSFRFSFYEVPENGGTGWLLALALTGLCWGGYIKGNITNH